ncbi:MAG TPA: TPM domain-containing protein [Rhizomicrobium sp.]|jgi:uncharacterized protein|nr:TPM domain-containing protein [Rhizomicrobium sp.]
MRAFAAVLAFLCLIAPGFAPGAQAAPKFPALTGRVVDDAGILSDSVKQDLTGKLAALEAKTSRQLVVVTVPSLQGYEISDFGYQLGRAWGIGQGKLNNGVLFIIAPNEHRTRIEVGYGLEPILTDALSSVIIQTKVLPAFRDGDYDAGTKAGVDALIEQLSLDTSTAEKRAAAAEHQVAQRGNGGPPVSAVIIFIVIVFIFLRMFGGWGALPFLFMGGGGRGGWGGGGGGWGGGGFSGGGGSFGGGGASGSW